MDGVGCEKFAEHVFNYVAPIIDEDTGLKEGEVTGGELVFNNDQTDTIEELVESGEGGKLVEFLRNLLSKKQFQK